MFLGGLTVQIDDVKNGFVYRKEIMKSERTGSIASAGSLLKKTKDEAQCSE
jgi:hypothetical protein